MVTINKDTYCDYLWHGAMVQTNGQVIPCCVYDGKPIGSVREQPLEAMWNSDVLTTLRKDMMNGIRPPGCHKCFDREDVGIDSMRMHSPKQVSQAETITDDNGHVSKFELSIIDIRFSNLCNLKCRMCGGSSSSSIMAESNELAKRKVPALIRAGSTIDQMYLETKQHYSTLETIYFAGGEPVVQWEFWQILDDLAALQRNDVTISINTNGTSLKFKDKYLIDYLTLFNRVNIMLSIDAYGAANDYWRSGSTWANIIANFELLLSTNAKVTISSAVGWPNAISWCKLVRFLIEEYNFVDINILPISSLNHHTVANAPGFKKEQIHRELLALSNYLSNINGCNALLNNIEFLIQMMLSDDHSQQLQHYFTQERIIDAHRNEDFFVAFPEHKDMRAYLLKDNNVT
jgi:radical SAM protein with 4Fe4S-binding SPASM domain